MLKNIIGSIVFVAVVLALVNFIGDAMVNPAASPHSPTPEKAEFVPPTIAQKAALEAAQNAPLLVGDAELGKKVFRKKCMGCHTMNKGDANRTGPNLWAVVDRAKGAMEGYRYSKPMSAAGGVWSEAELTAFIAGPRTFLPDTKMTFAGLKKAKDRANVIAYLKTLKD